MKTGLSSTDVHAAVEDLFAVDGRRGVKLTVFNVVTLNALLIGTFQAGPLWLFIAMALVTGIFYSSVMMTTHDAIHHTLTGWFWFDEIVPRFLSYFIFWPHGLYAELHKLHHRLNGKDLRDPESPTPTAAEYRVAGRVRRFMLRHRWWLSMFVYGGFGMIVRHAMLGKALWTADLRIKKVIQADLLGIAFAAAVTLAVITWAGVTWRYVLYLFIVERVIGVFQQMRSHLEHYGLHGVHGSPLETRLYNCRNVITLPAISRFFNGLNYHSVHHAFPRIPYYFLATAHSRLAAICAARGKPLPEGQGYLRTLIAVARTPMVLDAVGAHAVDEEPRAMDGAAA